MTAQTSSVDRGDWTDPALGKVTVGQWGETWLASKGALRETTRGNYEQLWRLHIQPRWGAVPLSRVTYAEVTTWVADLSAQGLGPSWVRQALQCLRQALDLAVNDGRLARNVAAQVKAPRVPTGEPRYLSHAQVFALADECGDYRTMVLLLAYTGLRFGEVRALRVSRVDPLRCRLNIAENVPDGTTTPLTPKNHQRRDVPFPSFLRDDMGVQMAGKAPSDLVFTSPEGSGFIDPSNWRRRVFDPAVQQLDLAPFTPHDLRDTAASLAISAGATVLAVARMLGHADPSVTLQIYAHLFPSDLDSVAARLDEAVKSWHRESNSDIRLTRSAH